MTTRLHHYLARLQQTILSREEMEVAEMEILVPHHPEIKTHPHHKHIGDSIIATEPPDLSEVLREIDAILYTT